MAHVLTPQPTLRDDLITVLDALKQRETSQTITDATARIRTHIEYAPLVVALEIEDVELLANNTIPALLLEAAEVIADDIPGLSPDTLQNPIQERRA